MYLSIDLSACLSVRLSVYLSVCLSVYLFIFPSIYLFVCLSVFLYIYLSVYSNLLNLIESNQIYLSIYLNLSSYKNPRVYLCKCTIFKYIISTKQTKHVFGWPKNGYLPASKLDPKIPILIDDTWDMFRISIG